MSGKVYLSTKKTFFILYFYETIFKKKQLPYLVVKLIYSYCGDFIPTVTRNQYLHLALKVAFAILL